MDIPDFFKNDGFLPGDPGCPYGLAHVPGIGGYLSGQPEDFIVDEVPAYEPSGEGEHWFVHLKKRGVSSPWARRVLAQSIGVSERDIGMAGRKDADAITTQWFSLPKEPLELNDDKIEIVSKSPHRHKLRLGHLKGNRFTIKLRNVDAETPDRLPDLLAHLRRGIPNYFGPQRFGRDGRGLSNSLGMILNS